jgi:hypothetical protein
MVVNFPAQEIVPVPRSGRSERALNAHQQQTCWNLMTIKDAMGRTFHGGS